MILAVISAISDNCRASIESLRASFHDVLETLKTAHPKPAIPLKRSSNSENQQSVTKQSKPSAKISCSPKPAATAEPVVPLWNVLLNTPGRKNKLFPNLYDIDEPQAPRPGAPGSEVPKQNANKVAEHAAPLPTSAPVHSLIC
jgi:hypothetical protein